MIDEVICNKKAGSKFRNQNKKIRNTTKNQNIEENELLSDLLMKSTEFRCDNIHKNTEHNTSVSFWTCLDKFNELSQSLNDVISKYTNLKPTYSNSSETYELNDSFRLSIIKGKTGSAVRQQFVIKKSAIQTLLNDKRLQFSTTQDAPKRKINNGYKMLDYKEGDIVMVLGVLYNKMLIGFVIDNPQILESNSDLIECMLIETKNLDSSILKYFPTGDRSYQIYGWSILGAEMKSK